jgi:protein lifeguard
MAANTRYQPAPQRDSFEENHYSQPPPAYQAEDATQAALLSGTPRGEDDNVPDDFKFGSSVAEASLDIRMQFVRKVYAIL